MFKLLSMDDRTVIKELWDLGRPIAEIARKIGVSDPCIARELKRGATGDISPITLRHGYDPELGARVFIENCKRRGNRKRNK